MLQFGRLNERFLLRSPFAGRALAGGAIVACFVFSTTSAAAYCRTRTCEFERLDNGEMSVPCQLDPDTLCALSSQDTYWDAVCLALSVHSEGSQAEGISAEQLGEQLDAALNQWLQVDCGAGPHVGAFVRGITQCDQLEFACSQTSEGTPPGYGANENIVVFRDGPSQLAFNQVALTTVTANLETGRVVDADIELNSFHHDFVLQSGPDQGEAYLLRTVLSHEFGHFLGLSHSLERGALMGMYGTQSAEPGVDDRAGFCEIWGGEQLVSCAPPDGSPRVCVGSDTDCPPQTLASVQNGGCACSVPGGGSGGGRLAWFGALSAMVLAGLRRRWRVPVGTVPAVLILVLSGCGAAAGSSQTVQSPGAAPPNNSPGASEVDAATPTAGQSPARAGRNSNTKHCVFRRGRQSVAPFAAGGGIGQVPLRPHHGLLGPMRCE